VIEEQGALYGDGVNIAARLQAMADPGGITVSANVYDLIKHRPPLRFDFMGHKRVKNISERIAAYRVQVRGQEFGGLRWALGSLLQRLVRFPRRGALLAAAAATALLVATTALLVGTHDRVLDPTSLVRVVDAIDTQSRADALALALPLPKRPSLAVLPFANLSGETDVAWLADGFSETLITDLAKLGGLFVTARNSAFQYKGQTIDIRAVGRELGVNYVLEGSVQRQRQRLRINAQLIDARSGEHLWAERYDRPLADRFQVQDEITRRIAEALDVALLSGQMVALRRGRTDNLNAFELLRRADAFWSADQEGQTCERYGRAGDLYRQAVAADPDYSSAWVGLARHHMRNVYFHCGGPREESLFQGLEAAERALVLDPEDADAYTAQALAYLFLRNYEDFQAASAQAARLGVNNADTLAYVAWGNLYVGRFEEARRLIRQALRLHPHYPAWYLNVLAMADFWLGSYRDAERALRISRTRLPGQPYTLVYTVAVAQVQNRDNAARQAAAALLARHPDFSVAAWLEDSEPYREYEARQLAALLRRAGLP
jgi:adenylate cyclase